MSFVFDKNVNVCIFDDSPFTYWINFTYIIYTVVSETY